jgi:hypothetical protein
MIRLRLKLNIAIKDGGCGKARYVTNKNRWGNMWKEQHLANS